MTVTKETKIGDILDSNAEAAQHFMAMGMHCLGCPAARNETVEQACFVHGVNPVELIKKITALFDSEG